MEGVVGMILAGGRGKRMDLLCHLRPKPALPFAGKLRVIDFSLSNCIHSQVRGIAVVVDYQRSYMGDYLREWAVANAGSAKISVLQPTVGSYMGTADAVCQNLAYLNSQAANRVLVLAGDHVYRMDYRKMLDFHEKVAADVTVGVIQVPVEEAYRFGTVVADSAGQIQEFVEKSSKPLGTLASMGIYIFNKNILNACLAEDASIQDSLHDFGYSILPGITKSHRVFAYEFKGYWQDIGTVEAYYQANMELLVERPRFSLDSNWPVLNDYAALPIPEGSSDKRIVNSLISPGCVIRGHVENSILSFEVRVAEQATVRNSVIMANTSIGYHSVVDKCILDEGVSVGDYSYIGFGTSLMPGDWDVTVVGKGAAIPSHMAVGRKCRIYPGVTPADFGARAVPAGAVVMRH